MVLTVYSALSPVTGLAN